MKPGSIITALRATSSGNGNVFVPISARPGWQDVPAVKHQQLFEIKSADILQPGPAALTDGITRLHRIVVDWAATGGARA